MYNNKILARILGVFALGCACVTYGNETIPTLNQGIELDGLLSESVWASAQKIELSYETYPAENKQAKYHSTAYLFTDAQYLYVGIKALDPDKASLRASYRDRDDISDEDMVGIKIDTFNDQRRSYNFFVNPLGIQEDSISDDVLDREDTSWNAIWYSAGQVTDSGYSVELKIPFKILRFSDQDAIKNWAIDLVRFVPKEFDYRFASNPVDRNKNCTICQYKKYNGFESISTGKNLEIIPYLVANKHESRDLNQTQDWQSGDEDIDGGVDLRWAISDNSILNATVNPDFSQVESDSAQLDVNTRFALFYDEKRPFFLEGADYFNTMLTIFYSRNIADPDAGIKYTSKDENGSLGLLISSDNNTNIILPSSQSSRLVSLDEESNSAVARYAYDLSDSTLLGLTLTHRDAGEYSNDLLSFDGKHQVTDTDVFRYQLIHTQTDNPLEFQANYGLDASESGNAYRLNYSHNDRDWSWFVSHNHFDKEFRADLGFLTRSGYRKTIIGGGHRWYGDDGDFFSRIELRGDWDTSVQYDGQRLETETEMILSLEGRSQSEIDFHFGTRDVYFDQQWFEQDFYTLSTSFKPVNSLRLGFLISQADEIDFLSSNARAGESQGYEVFADWQITKHLKLDLEYLEQTFDVANETFFDAKISNLKLIYQFNEKSFVRFLAQYSDYDFTQGLADDRSLARQLLYAYKFDAKSVLYIGYSDGAIEQQQTASLEQNQRTLFAKFSYAFQL
ncbi:MAG: carbohydrate binding family 9 domain-containing protein [Gammaproteobacteria bacterium]|nr:carbohydrate binding family 9 domain-containing protein [Gammaproteobacteria bacterium]